MFYAVFLPRWKQFSLVASLNVGSIPAGDVYLAKSGQTRQKSDRNQPIFGTRARAAPLYGLFLRLIRRTAQGSGPTAPTRWRGNNIVGVTKVTFYPLPVRTARLSRSTRVRRALRRSALTESLSRSTSWRAMKKQRNQPDRLPFVDRLAIRIVAGGCPSCAPSSAVESAHDGNQSKSMKDLLGVIYRRSAHSVTFRCNHCSLKWTVTLVSLRKAAQSKIDKITDESLKDFYGVVVSETRGVDEREAARRTAIKHQTNRRVIRL